MGTPMGHLTTAYSSISAFKGLKLTPVFPSWMDHEGNCVTWQSLFEKIDRLTVCEHSLYFTLSPLTSLLSFTPMHTLHLLSASYFFSLPSFQSLLIVKNWGDNWHLSKNIHKSFVQTFRNRKTHKNVNVGNREGVTESKPSVNARHFLGRLLSYQPTAIWSLDLNSQALHFHVMLCLHSRTSSYKIQHPPEQQTTISISHRVYQTFLFQSLRGSLIKITSNGFQFQFSCTLFDIHCNCLTLNWNSILLHCLYTSVLITAQTEV